MIRTSITPQQTDVVISIPPQYIGKKLEMLLYAVEEVTEKTTGPTTMAQFWDVISDETARDLHEQTVQSRVGKFNG